MTKEIKYEEEDMVVYPAHGVGRVSGLETIKVGGVEVSLYCINFKKERMTLKVPVHKAEAAGLRHLSSKDSLKKALNTLQGRSRIRRAMWSRRAQEYESKINSGNPVSVAEVLRDLRRKGDDIEQSYSERQIYQSALSRLSREFAAIENIDEEAANLRLERVLYKGRPGGPKTEEEKLAEKLAEQAEQAEKAGEDEEVAAAA